MSDPQPDLDHPIVEIAQRMMRPNGQGGWIFEAKDAEILEAAILQEKNDPKIDGAILGLFEVAAQLHEKHGSTEAAGALLAVLGRVGPRLPLRTDAQAALTSALDRGRDWMSFMGGKKKPR
jgi:hypothetical protein